MDPDEQRQSPSDEDVFDVRPVPPGVANHMRTLESSPEPGPGGLIDAADFAQRAAEVLAEIEDALYDDLGVDDNVTALGISEERNTVTGGRSLILRRLMRRGRYSAPLAEIFTESGRLDLRAKQRFHAFRSDAYQYGLDLWMHELLVGERLVYMAFAVASEGEDSDTFWYLARLLVTPFEIGQWSDPFLEIACARPS